MSADVITALAASVAGVLTALIGALMVQRRTSAEAAKLAAETTQVTVTTARDLLVELSHERDALKAAVDSYSQRLDEALTRIRELQDVEEDNTQLRQENSELREQVAKLSMQLERFLQAEKYREERRG